MARMLVISLILCLLMFAAKLMAAEATAVKTETGPDRITLDNRILKVLYNTQTGVFTARRGDRLFVTEGRLVETPGGEAPRSKVVELRDALGVGRAIEAMWPDGRIRRLALYDSMPFLCVSAAVRNDTDQPMTVEQITPLWAKVDVGTPPDGLRGFAPEGPVKLGDKTHFCFAAAVDPQTNSGVVCGWLSHYRGSGVVRIAVDGAALNFESRSEYGRLAVPAHATAEGETLAIGYFPNALDGLEAYADGCAKAHRVKLRDHVPSGYCTWYHAGGSNQEQIAELADFCGRELKKFGFEFVQIDDGWQLKSRDFTTFNPKGRYSDGMKATAERIVAHGLTAGIWYIPFGWDPKCGALADHGDWFVHRPDGSIYTVTWAGSCLDMTHPDARRFLTEVVARISKEWGYKYIKIDGLWTGMATEILYPSLTYRPDKLGEAVLHDPSKTQIEAYRSGLRLVREATGDDVFILGCNIAQNARTLGASFGLVDGMRIGHDIGASWRSIRGCALPTSHLYFLHNKVWFNDPDCLMLRDPLTLDQARLWGSLLSLSGQLNIVSEWLPGLPPEKLDVVKRTMPNHGGLGRPIDLFSSELPTIWHYQGSVGDQRVDLVGLLNWDEKGPSRVELDVKRLGLPAGPEDVYVGFDFWEDALVPPFSGRQAFDLRPSSCRVLALHRQEKHPQLVGTSRHVTQGVVDVAAVAWDESAGTLGGRSKVVAGDPYQLRIFVPQAAGTNWKATAATVSEADRQAGVTVAMKQDGPLLRVDISSPTSREVAWSVVFSGNK